MLIVFSGLPGTGKTTIASALAVQMGAFYVRIDAIEQAILRSLGTSVGVGAAGYDVALAVAEGNVGTGRVIVVDCVNPVAQSPAAWRHVADRLDVKLHNIEIICSDAKKHQRQVEMRVADIPGHAVPNWEAVARHEYEAWTEERLVVDTALVSPAEAVRLIVAAVAR